MSRYRDDRAALEANIERLESELEDAVGRLAELDGDGSRTAAIEIEEILGAPGSLGVPQTLGLRAELDETLSPEGLEAIAAMLRLRLNLPISVLDGVVSSSDGRFLLRAIAGRTELRLDWTFVQADRRHKLAVAATTMVTALASGVLLHEAAGLTVGAALSNLLWIVPVAGVVLAPLLGPPYARRVLHEQELFRDAFRAAIALAKDDHEPKRARVAEDLAQDENEDLASSDAGDFEGDAEIGESDEEDETDEADEASQPKVPKAPRQRQR